MQEKHYFRVEHPTLAHLYHEEQILISKTLYLWNSGVCGALYSTVQLGPPFTEPTVKSVLPIGYQCLNSNERGTLP